MKNLSRLVTIMGAVSGACWMTAGVMVGCSGDTTTDGGDAANDVTVDSPPDVVGMDASDASDGSDVADTGSDVNPIVAFQDQQAAAFCKRFQTCCDAIDGGPTFDYNHCLAAEAPNSFGGAGFNGSDQEATAEVIARGNLTLNSTAANSCLAGLSTMSCPVLSSTEVTAVTGNCFAAVVGTLGTGGACIASIECTPGSYCKFAGIDAGTTDAGTAIGQCAPLIAQGQPCGFAPYGNPNYVSTECEYKGYPPPNEFCDYDSLVNPDAGAVTCQPTRSNSAGCFVDFECQSGFCGAAGQDCFGSSCTCVTSRDFSSLCQSLAIKDAGGD